MKKIAILLLLSGSSICYAGSGNLCQSIFEEDATSIQAALEDAGKPIKFQQDKRTLFKTPFENIESTLKPSKFAKKSAPNRLSDEQYFEQQYYRMVRGYYASVRPAGLMLFFGIGTEKDTDLGMIVLKGLNQPVEYTIGKAYQEGIKKFGKTYLESDYGKAFEYLEVSAREGHKESISLIRLMALRGHGESIDYIESLK